MDTKAARTVSSICLLLLGLLLVPVAAAQTPVTDAVHIKTNKFAWVEQYRQMVMDETNQLRQIYNQYQQIEAQLRDLQEQRIEGLVFKVAPGPRISNLPRRAAGEFVEDRCGSGGGGLLGYLLGGGGMGPSRVREARQQQYGACVAMVHVENEQHNFLVDVIEKIQDMDQEIARLQEESAETGPDQRGRLARNSNAIQQLQVAQAAEMEHAQRQLQFYGQQVDMYRNAIATFGRSAFSDSDKPLAQLAQYGTLKAALEIARMRER